MTKLSLSQNCHFPLYLWYFVYQYFYNLRLYYKSCMLGCMEKKFLRINFVRFFILMKTEHIQTCELSPQLKTSHCWRLPLQLVSLQFMFSVSDLNFPCLDDAPFETGPKIPTNNARRKGDERRRRKQRQLRNLQVTCHHFHPLSLSSISVLSRHELAIHNWHRA